MSAKTPLFSDKYYLYICKLYPSEFIVKNGEIIYYKLTDKHENRWWRHNNTRFGSMFWISCSTLQKELTENDLFLLML